MTTSKQIPAGLLAAFGMVTLLTPLAPTLAGSKQTQQEATGALLGAAYLLYNYVRHQNKKNGAYAIAGAAGTAYLWNKYGQQRGAEKRQEQAKLDYYRRRSAYYHKLALRAHRHSRTTHR